jgi:hypothetical protein
MKDAIYLIRDENSEKSVHLEPTPYRTEDDDRRQLDLPEEVIDAGQMSSRRYSNAFGASGGGTDRSSEPEALAPCRAGDRDCGRRRLFGPLGAGPFVRRSRWDADAGRGQAAERHAAEARGDRASPGVCRQRLLGQTIESQLARRPVERRPSAVSGMRRPFFAVAATLPGATQEALRRIYALSSGPLFFIWFGTVFANGSCNVCRPSIGAHVLVSGLSNGNLQPMFGSLSGSPHEVEACNRMGEFAETVLGVMRGSDWRKQYPVVPPYSWVPRSTMWSLCSRVLVDLSPGLEVIFGTRT